MAEPKKESGSDWLIGDPAGAARSKRGSRGLPEVPALDVSEAVNFLEYGGKAAAKVRDDIGLVARSAREVLNAGLTKNALLLLVQDLCRTDKHGNKPSLDNIERVLSATASLDRHLVSK